MHANMKQTAIFRKLVLKIVLLYMLYALAQFVGVFSDSHFAVSCQFKKELL